MARSLFLWRRFRKTGTRSAINARTEMFIPSAALRY